MMDVMNELFARRLTRLRREAGFKSAYRFYHGNGGRRHFPFTYVHYLRLEKGASLPRPGWLARLLAALRLSPGAEASRGLLEAYLKGLLGGEAEYALIVAPLRGPAAATRASGAGALRWLREEHALHMTPAQFRVVAADETTYWCSEVLSNDGGAWSPAELAAKLGLDEKKTAAGLARLAAARLAKRAAADRYRSRKPGMLYTFPGRLEGMGGELRAVSGYWEKMARRRGKDAFARVEVVRAEAGFMSRYAADLGEAVDAVNLGAARSAGDDTGLYLVEAAVRKLTPF